MIEVFPSKKIYFFTAIFFILFFILPFGYLVEFTAPAKDDFCLAASFSEYLQSVKKWYMHLNGRYINALVSSIPVIGNNLRKVILYFLFFLTGVILFVFTERIMKYYKIEVLKAQAFFLSILIFITVIAKVPSLNELFFWYSSVTVYLLSFFFFLIFLMYVLKAMLGYKAPIVAIGMATVFLNGNNELFIGITNFLLLLLLFKSYLKYRVLKFSFLLLNVVSWISTAAFVFAPGSTNRQQQFDYGGNLIGSIKVAVIYGGKFIIESFLDPTYLFFYLFTFILVYRNSEMKNKQVFNPFLLMVISFICMASMFFIVYYATGLFSVRQGRIGDVVSMVLLILIFLNVLNMAVFLKARKKFISLNSSYLQLIPGIGFVLCILFVNENYANARSDFSNGRFERFRNDFKQRDSVLKHSEQDRIILKPIEGTLILHSGDGYLEQEEIMKNCYIKFVNKKYNKSYSEIEIKSP